MAIFGESLDKFSGSTLLPKGYDFIYLGIFALAINVVTVLVIHGIMAGMHKVKDEGIIENEELVPEM